MKTLIIINQFWLNSLLKSIQNIAKNWMSKLSPNENLNNKNNNQIQLVRWVPNKKTSRWQSIFINKGLNPLFHHPVLLLILNYHNSESNCAQPKTNGSATPILFFFIWGSFRNKKGLFPVNHSSPSHLRQLSYHESAINLYKSQSHFSWLNHQINIGNFFPVSGSERAQWSALSWSLITS